MEVFKKRQALFLIQLIVFTLLLFTAHSYIQYYFSDSIEQFLPLWKIYVFNVFVTAIIYTVINYRYSFAQKTIFILFMSMTLFKMVLTILFLFPLFFSSSDVKKTTVLNFFIAYFFFLFFEILSLIKLLKARV
tara:strand:- start:108 stop:506 length:399 start_codon:yes stop_codon:yes gene_type:complete